MRNKNARDDGSTVTGRALSPCRGPPETEKIASKQAK